MQREKISSSAALAMYRAVEDDNDLMRRVIRRLRTADIIRDDSWLMLSTILTEWYGVPA